MHGVNFQAWITISYCKVLNLDILFSLRSYFLWDLSGSVETLHTAGTIRPILLGSNEWRRWAIESNRIKENWNSDSTLDTTPITGEEETEILVKLSTIMSSGKKSSAKWKEEVKFTEKPRRDTRERSEGKTRSYIQRISGSNLFLYLVAFILLKLF